MALIEKVHRYLDNARKVLRSRNNPLKKPENLKIKDKLEKEFYDQEAEEYLVDFREDVFLYDENEKMPTSHRFFYSQLENVSGKKILDICCGYGFSAVRMAKKGADVTGVDISPKMLELARRNAALNGVNDETRFLEMSVQEMEFENDSFDYVIGMGALHHLNIDKAGKEISRVLKPGGLAIFIEPRIPFQWLIFVRALIPTKCLESPGGAQLSDKEISRFSSYFSSMQINYFLFLRKLARLPFVNRFSEKLDVWDQKIIERFPRMKKFYWAFVVQFTK